MRRMDAYPHHQKDVKLLPVCCGGVRRAAPEQHCLRRGTEERLRFVVH